MMTGTYLLTGKLMQNGEDPITVTNLILQGAGMLLQSFEACCEFICAAHAQILQEFNP